LRRIFLTMSGSTSWSTSPIPGISGHMLAEGSAIRHKRRSMRAAAPLARGYIWFDGYSRRSCHRWTPPRHLRAKIRSRSGSRCRVIARLADLACS
jgi:hypothetical protein